MQSPSALVSTSPRYLRHPGRLKSVYPAAPDSATFTALGRGGHCVKIGHLLTLFDSRLLFAGDGRLSSRPFHVIGIESVS